jgi:predicted amidophosphoribosyltransferase
MMEGCLTWAARLLPLEWLVQGPDDRAGRHGVGSLAQPVCGEAPLTWWAAGAYDGALRRELLTLRRHRNPQRLLPLVQALAGSLRNDPRLPRGHGTALLVPVPSWKRRCNPMPGLLAEQLSSQTGWPVTPVLARSRPVLGQHRLNRELRWANQQDAFRCGVPAREHPHGRRPVLLLDDILTTGATACSAAASLRSSGWRLLGLVCLARTPERRRP